MLKLRKANERGHTDLSWLDSWHTFSFDQYYDPEYEHFGPLRVINEDIVAEGGGFGTHPHRDMEIITYVLQGSVEHKDSLGNGSVIVPGEVQRMSAGTGIHHSEFNHSSDNPVHLLQIWIIPNMRGLKPSYEQKSFDINRGGGWQLVVSPEAGNNSLRISQDASLYIAKLAENDKLLYEVKDGRIIWLQVAEGNLEINGHKMTSGDGASVTEEKSISISANSDAHVLLFDLARIK